MESGLLWGKGRSSSSLKTKCFPPIKQHSARARALFLTISRTQALGNESSNRCPVHHPNKEFTSDAFFATCQNSNKLHYNQIISFTSNLLLFSSHFRSHSYRLSDDFGLEHPVLLIEHIWWRTNHQKCYRNWEQTAVFLDARNTTKSRTDLVGGKTVARRTSKWFMGLTLCSRIPSRFRFLWTGSCKSVPRFLVLFNLSSFSGQTGQRRREIELRMT